MKTKKTAIFKRYLSKHRTSIVACVSVIGVVGTGVFTAKGAIKANEVIKEYEENVSRDVSTKERIKLAIPCYLPAIITGGLTIISIFSIDILSKQQQKSLMSAYMALDNMYKNYKDKVLKIAGEETASMVESELIRDDYKVIEERELDNQILYFEPFTKQYLWSTKEQINEASYLINRKMHEEYDLSLNDYLSILGLQTVGYGTSLGWSLGLISEAYWLNWLDFDLQEFVLDDGTVCTMLATVEPSADYTGY